jgi:hypothetical protein
LVENPALFPVEVSVRLDRIGLSVSLVAVLTGCSIHTEVRVPETLTPPVPEIMAG